MPDDSLRGWIVTHSRKNFWRVAGRMEFDDLISEGVIKYFECRRYYGTSLAPKHFMALFKTAFGNRITDLAKDRTRQGFVMLESELHVTDGDGETVSYENIPSDVADENSRIAQLVADAPAGVRELLKAFVEGGLDMLQSFKVFSDGSRETSNQFLVRLLGLDTDPDLYAETRRYLLDS